MFAPRGAWAWISPSTVQLPWELPPMLPEGVGIVCTALNVRAHQASEFDRAQQGIEGAIETVVTEGARAVVLAGVPFAARLGYAGDTALHQQWSERFGVPVISSTAAAVEALRALGCQRPVLATAYLPALNDQIVAYLAEAGITVAGAHGLAVRSPAEAAAVSDSAYYGLARDLVAAHPAADAILFGTRGNILREVLHLEADLGLPALHSPWVGLWWALGHLRVAPRSGCGRIVALRERAAPDA